MVVLALALVAAIAGCTDSGGSPAARPPAGTDPEAASPALVVASTPIVGALVQAVAGDQVDVRVLLPAPEPPDGSVVDPSAAIEGADLVVLIDPDHESGLTNVVASAGAASIDVLLLAPELGPIPLGTSQLGSSPSEPSAATVPHVWLDPDRWTQAARLVADRLGAAVPGIDEGVLQANVAAFDELLGRADETMQALVATLPDDRRVVVTDLAALVYVTDRYGFELVLASGADELGAAATANDVPAVFTSVDRHRATVDALASAAPTIAVVPLELDHVATGDADGATGPMVSVTETLVAALSD